MRGPTSFAIRCVLAACAASAAALAPPRARADDAPAEPAESSPDFWMERIRAIVAAGPGDGGTDGLASRLAALGPAAIPAVFSVFERSDGDFRAPVSRDALLACFRKLPPSSVLAHLRGRTSGETPRDTLIDAMVVVEQVGGEGSTPLVLDLAARLKPLEIRSPALGGVVRSALAAALRSDAEGWAELRRRWTGLESGLRTVVLDAVEETQSVEGLRFLGDALQPEADSNADVLHRMCRMPRLARDPVGKSALEKVRWFAQSGAPDVRRNAILVLGLVHDAPSFDVALELAGGDDPDSADAALWALRRMTGAALDSDRAAWIEWRADDAAWRLNRRGKETSLLAAQDVDLVVATLASLGRRRLHGAEVAADVAPLLGHSDQRVRRAACSALGALDAPEALDALVVVIADRDPDVRRAANDALRAISGLTLPEDQKAWRRALR